METTQLTRFLPNLTMISEELNTVSIAHSSYVTDSDIYYKGVRIYHDPNHLEKDLIYIIDKNSASTFPVNEYSYISTDELPGKANHLICPESTSNQLMDFLLDLFTRYSEQENLLNQLVFKNAGLDEMC